MAAVMKERTHSSPQACLVPSVIEICYPCKMTNQVESQIAGSRQPELMQQTQVLNNENIWEETFRR